MGGRRFRLPPENMTTIATPSLDTQGTSRMVLFPLADEVCFPQTELRLQVIDPGYQELVSDLFLEVGNGAWLGTVLLRPDHEEQAQGPTVFTAGTAARLLDYESHEEGCDILLRGEYRFRIERELGWGSRLEGLVRPISEPLWNEGTDQARSLQQELLDRTLSLASELGDRFALDDEQLGDLLCGTNFEQVVNQLSAHLDLSPLRKLRLLQDSLPERAEHLAEILRSRCQVLDTLRPFRHLALAAQRN